MNRLSQSIRLRSRQVVLSLPAQNDSFFNSRANTLKTNTPTSTACQWQAIEGRGCSGLRHTLPYAKLPICSGQVLAPHSFVAARSPFRNSPGSIWLIAPLTVARRCLTLHRSLNFKLAIPAATLPLAAVCPHSVWVKPLSPNPCWGFTFSRAAPSP